FVKRTLQTALLIAMTDLPNGRGSQRNHAGNAGRADTLGQWQKRGGPQDDSHRLHAAAQQFLQLLLVLGCDFNTKCRIGHTQSMRPVVRMRIPSHGQSTSRLPPAPSARRIANSRPWAKDRPSE